MISDRDLFDGFPPKVFRNRALLDLANGQRCVRCGANDGTIVPAHFHGKFAHLFGKAGSQRASDVCVCHLCHSCHEKFDAQTLSAGGWNNEDEKALEFMVCIMRTLHVLMHEKKLILIINKRPRNAI